MSDAVSPPFSMRARLIWVAAVIGFVIALDQLTKQIILAKLQPGQVIEVIPSIFNVLLTFNTGAAFGMWGGLPDGVRKIVLAITILVALGTVASLFRQPGFQSRIGHTALAAILGGALGNIIDRAMHGAVVDFIDFYWGTYHWPAFNVADSAICMGVIVLVLLPYGRIAKSTSELQQAS